MLPGDDIYDQIESAIQRSDKVLLCCSKASLSSWWVESEIDAAFAKERHLADEKGAKSIALIPLNIDGTLFEWRSGRAEKLRSRLAADFTGWEEDDPKFQRQVDRLALGLRVRDVFRLFDEPNLPAPGNTL